MPTGEALLLRSKAAEALTNAGFPISTISLATYATRGGGPPYFKFSNRTFYKMSDLLEWAQSRSSGVVRSTAEYST